MKSSKDIAIYLEICVDLIVSPQYLFNDLLLTSSHLSPPIKPNTCIDPLDSLSRPTGRFRHPWGQMILLLNDSKLIYFSNQVRTSPKRYIGGTCEGYQYFMYTAKEFACLFFTSLFICVINGISHGELTPLKISHWLYTSRLNISVITMI